MAVVTISTVRGLVIDALDGQSGWRHSVTWLVNDQQVLEQRFKVEVRDTTLPTNPGRRQTGEGLAVETQVEVHTAQRLKTGNPSDAYQDALDQQDTLRGLVLDSAVGQAFHLLYDGSNRIAGDTGWLNSVHRFTCRHRI